jgi:hypothetical protein
LGVANASDLRQIEQRIGALRHRLVQISLVDQFSAIPAAVAGSIGASIDGAPAYGASTDEPASTVTGLALRPARSREEDPGPAAAILRQPAPETSESARPGLKQKRRRPQWLGTAVVDGAGVLAAAGTLAPGAIEHGSAQVVLVAVGGALLGTFSARFMDRASKWFDRAAEGRATS